MIDLSKHIRSLHAVEQRQAEFDACLDRHGGTPILQKVTALLEGRLTELRDCSPVELFLVRQLARIALLDSVNRLVQRKLDDDACNGR